MDLALGFPGVLEKILTACGDAKDFSHLDRVSKLFHAPTQTMCVKDESGAIVRHTVSLVERALRRMSEQAGRGVRGVALPQTPAGPPLQNWAQVLLRELRRGFWRKGTAAAKGDAQEDRGGKMSGGHHHSLFVTKGGAVYSCGLNTINIWGMLGHGHTERQNIPKRIEALSGVRVHAVSAGVFHSLLLTEGGSVWSCGTRDSAYGGLLGHGVNTEHHSVPKRIEALSGEQVCAVSAGADHSLFLTEDGTAYSCGRGAYGRLGHGNGERQHVPKRIEALSAS